MAAGHSPIEIMDWTWSQIAIAASAVNTYHLDLVSRIVTGKSPVFAQAEKDSRSRRETEAIKQRLQAQANQDRDRDAEAVQAEAEMLQKAAEFAKLGFAINIRKG